MILTLNNKEYQVKEAKTTEEKEKGLSNIKELPENEGMLFYYDSPRTVSMWMKDTLIPLDIIFINEDLEVISVKKGVPNSEKFITENNVSYVLELNVNSGAKAGDEVDFGDDSGPVMKVLFLDGTSQMDLWGGERIVSRRETKILINKAKKAEASNSESDYKALGKYIFKVFNKLDNRNPEYVTAPELN